MNIFFLCIRWQLYLEVLWGPRLWRLLRRPWGRWPDFFALEARSAPSWFRPSAAGIFWRTIRNKIIPSSKTQQRNILLHRAESFLGTW